MAASREAAPITCAARARVTISSRCGGPIRAMVGRRHSQRGRLAGDRGGWCAEVVEIDLRSVERVPDVGIRRRWLIDSLLVVTHNLDSRIIVPTEVWSRGHRHRGLRRCLVVLGHHDIACKRWICGLVLLSR